MKNHPSNRSQLITDLGRAQFAPPPPTKFNFLSLGAGVQSSALAMMAARGDIKPRLDGAIFADTQAEPPGVMSWLEILREKIADSPHPFPIYTVTAGDLSIDAAKTRTTADGRTYYTGGVPYYVQRPGGSIGRNPHRSCTHNYKIKPIGQLMRQLAQIKHKQYAITVTQWIGISLDEIQRAKSSRWPWAVNRFPLIWLRMTRQDCLTYLRQIGLPEPPRSACYFCPYRSGAEWAQMKVADPETFGAAVEFEKRMQAARPATKPGHTKSFLHRTCIPLGKVKFQDADLADNELQPMHRECAGMCGI